MANFFDDLMPPLPPPYSNIYPADNDLCAHLICYSPAFQPGNGRPPHQPVFTAGQMREYVQAATDPLRLALRDAVAALGGIQSDNVPATVRAALGEA